MCEQTKRFISPHHGCSKCGVGIYPGDETIAIYAQPAGESIEEIYCKTCMRNGPIDGPVGSKPVDMVDHPTHYGGGENPYEAIKVIEAWDLGFHLGNTLKYIFRAGKKSKNTLEDLRKSLWYLDRYIKKMEEGNERQG